MDIQKPSDWGISHKDSWVSFEELKDNGAPALEGRDIVSFSSIKLAPGKPPTATTWKDINGRQVSKNPQTGKWALDKQQGTSNKKSTPAQKMERVRKSGGWGGPTVKESTSESQPKSQTEPKPKQQSTTEKKEAPQYNVEVPNRAKRGSKKILLNEEDLKNNFPDEKEQEIVKRLVDITNSQLVDTNKGALFGATEGKGGKADRTLLWEEAEALSKRSDQPWSELISSKDPYDQDKVDNFRDSVFTKDVSAKMAEYVYSHLPATAKVQLNKNGTPKSFFTGEGNTPDEQSKGSKPTSARGVAILHTYFRQGGKDAYTGLPVKLGDTEAEHINVQAKGGLDHPNNLVLIRGGVNQLRGNNSLQSLTTNAKAAFGDGGDAAKEKLEKTRESRASGSSQRADAKSTINNIPLDELLNKDWEEMRKEFDGMTGGNKGTQYALRRVNLYNLGNRLRGGKVVTPSTISIPLGRAYWQGTEEERQRVRDDMDNIRESFKNWLNDGSGDPKRYILSVHTALQNAGASEEEMRRAFLDKFFIDVSKTNNDWLVKEHGYKETNPEDLKAYYETL